MSAFGLWWSTSLKKLNKISNENLRTISLVLIRGKKEDESRQCNWNVTALNQNVIPFVPVEIFIVSQHNYKSIRLSGIPHSENVQLILFSILTDFLMRYARLKMQKLLQQDNITWNERGTWLIMRMMKWLANLTCMMSFILSAFNQPPACAYFLALSNRIKH